MTHSSHHRTLFENALRLWRDTRAEAAMECVLILAVGVVPLAGLGLLAVRVTANYLALLTWAIASPWP